jgi:hypothetical protein
VGASRTVPRYHHRPYTNNTRSLLRCILADVCTGPDSVALRCQGANCEQPKLSDSSPRSKTPHPDYDPQTFFFSRQNAQQTSFTASNSRLGVQCFFVTLYIGHISETSHKSSNWPVGAMVARSPPNSGIRPQTSGRLRLRVRVPHRSLLFASFYSSSHRESFPIFLVFASFA